MKKKTRRYLILIILSFIIIICSYHITAYIVNYYQLKKLNEEFNEVEEDNKTFLNVDFNQLLSLNSETVGFLKVTGTAINYPVVKGSDNSFYLSHGFDRKENVSGAIYLDYRNDLDNLSRNNIIYGHGRVDGTMFGSLNNLLEKEWFNNEDNHFIKVTTPYNKMIFEIFSVYLIPKESYYLTTYFTSDEYFAKFLTEITTRSIYNFNSSVDVKDKILTLSTCKNNFGMRFVVHAKLIKKEETS